MQTVEEIYRRCEKTAAWYGIAITHFDQCNFLDDTVLHTVCSWGELDAVKTLVAAGANVNARGDQGGTPLFNAVIGENADVISFLLKSGADPRIPNNYKRLVLDYAKHVGAPILIVQLLEKATKKGS